MSANITTLMTGAAQRTDSQLELVETSTGQQIANRLTSTLFIIALAQVCAPPLINGVLGSGGFRLVAEASNTAAASFVSDGLRLILATTALGAIAWSIIHRRTTASPLLLGVFLAPFAYLFARTLYISSATAGVFVAVSLTLVAIWVLRPSFHLLGFVGHSVGFIAVLSLILGALVPSVGIFVDQTGAAISLDKWSPLGSLLRGVFSHPNTLGQFMAIGIWVVFLVPRPRTRAVYLLSCLLALVWSGSRTALLVTMALVTLTVILKIAGSAVVRAASITGLGTVMVALVALIPLYTRDPSAYSYRGQIWIGSLQAWRESETFGLGGDWYLYISGFSNQLIAAAFHAHNAFIHYLTTGGIALIVVAGLLTATVVWRVSMLAGDGILWPAMTVLATLALSAQEVPLNFSQLTATGPLTWFLWAILLFSLRPDGAHIRRKVTNV